EEQLRPFVSAVVADKSSPEDDRVNMLVMQGNLPLMKKLGMRLFIEGQSKFMHEFDAAAAEALADAQQKFPKSGRVYEFTLALAERSKDRDQQKQLAARVMKAEGAPDAMKTLARHLFNGTKPYEI